MPVIKSRYNQPGGQYGRTGIRPLGNKTYRPVPASYEIFPDGGGGIRTDERNCPPPAFIGKSASSPW